MKLLFVVNGYPPTAVAGTEVCTRRLCAALKGRGHAVSVLAREERPGWPEYKLLEGELDGIPVTRVVNNFTRLDAPGLFERHPRVEEIFAGWMDRERPDLVHVQHLAGTSWGIPGIVRARGVPLVISLHDYWYACTRAHLLRPDGGPCSGPDGGKNCARYCGRGALAYLAAGALERARYLSGFTGHVPGQRACLAALASLQPLLFPGRSRRLLRAFGERCAKLLGALASADALVAPSARAREIYASLGVPAEKIAVISHGAPPFSGRLEGSGLPPYDGSRPLVVGYAGTITPHKGVVTLLAAVRRHPPSRVRLVLRGRAYPPRFERYFRRAAGRLPTGQVTVGGMYGTEELPGILAGMDIVAIPSSSHETFSLVLWEAWAAGLPVLASRVGALADSVRDGSGGLTFPPGDRRALAGRIGALLARPALLAELRNGLPRTPMSLEENARRYEELYRGVLERRGCAGA